MAKKIVLLIVIMTIIATSYYFYQKQFTQISTKMYGNVDIHQVDLSFEISNRITSINVKEGDFVKEGDVIAVVDSKALELQLNSAKTELDIAKEKLQKLVNGNREEDIQYALMMYEEAKAKRKFAEINYQRKSDVYNQTNGKGLSKTELDEANTSLKSYVAAEGAAHEKYKLMKNGARVEDINLAKLEIQTIENRIAILEDQISRTILKAPQNAIVRARLAEVGDLASAAKTSFILTLTENKYVRAYVNETNLPKVKVGETVKIKYDYGNGIRYLNGKVGFISDVAEFSPKNIETEEVRRGLVYEVRINVEDYKNELKMGIPVTIEMPELQSEHDLQK